MSVRVGGVWECQWCVCVVWGGRMAVELPLVFSVMMSSFAVLV